MTKRSKNIYVHVRKLGVEKNAKRKSVRNGPTYSSNVLHNVNLAVGAIFFLSFCFSFSHLLVIVYSFLFPSGISLVTLLLLFAVCKFRYSLLPRPYLLPVFYAAISVTSFLEVGFFFGGSDHQPYLSQHLVSSFVFIVFSFISFCSRLKVVFSVL